MEAWMGDVAVIHIIVALAVPEAVAIASTVIRPEAEGIHVLSRP